MTYLEVLAESFNHVDKRLETKSNSTGFVVLPFLFLDEWSCDIQMCPCGACRHKFLQEESSRQRSSQRSAGVVQIGAGGLDQLLIFLGERKFPEALPMILSGLDYGSNQFRVVSHHSGNAVSQRAQYSSGERGNVENMGCFGFSGKMKSVGKNETAFGIRVVDHDGLAILGKENVSRA